MQRQGGHGSCREHLPAARAAVWGPAYGTETQYLRVYASQLRRKLDEDPASPRRVTEPGVGYRLVERVPGRDGDGR